MTDVEQALAYAHKHQDAAIQELQSFLRIASISTLPEREPDMLLAAQFIADQLDGFGFEDVKVMSTDRHPVVYGAWNQAGPQAPTMLVYGHYDVQPVDPLDEWVTDPFEPQIRGDNIFARGASDMKAQVLAHMKAIEAFVRTSSLPVNIKYMIEGEEEIGSPSLEAFLRQHESLLSSDFCLNLDAGILGPETPSLTYALRGLAYFEIRLKGPAADLHSGIFGGAVANPANVLSRLLARMHDQDGKVTLPGFYDDVLPLSEEERAALAKLPQTEDWWKQQAGAPALDGEAGFTPTERATARPTLDINGLLSGFTGEGSKTVLPARAMGKLSMRLVPDQDPQKIKAGLKAFLQAHAPDTVTWELIDHASCHPAMIDRHSKPVMAASKALKEVWDVEPLFNRQGGSVPVVGMIQELLGLDSLLLGFGLPDDNLHAPNEKQYIPNFYRATETYIRFMQHIAAS